MIRIGGGRRVGRAARGPSRRDALLGLAGSALAVMASRPPSTVEAKGKHKGLKRCRAQVQPCRTVILSACTEPGCADRLLPCCEPLATCDAGSALQCIATNAGN